MPAAQRPPGDELTYVYSPDTQHIEGTLHSVTCADKKKEVRIELVLDRAGQTLRFESTSGAAGFTDTLWYGGDHFSICQHMQGRRVIVVYKPTTDPGFAGDFRYLEIRVDPPAVPTATVPTKGAVKE